jgi:pimeloyl-ACP methyl ester carboxylesterase
MPGTRIDTHNLDYRWIGPPPNEAPTIVFLHEGLGCVEMWRDFPDRVAEASGCGALVYSRLGYGKSDPIELPRPVSFMHEEALSTLASVFKSFEIQNAVLFGHSDGGSIALIHAGGKKSPVNKLILEAPHVFVEEFGLESIRQAAELYETGDLRAKLSRYHADVDGAFWGWNKVWLNPEFQSWNIEKYLPNISVPVLVIQGVQDQYGTWEQVEAIEKGCAGPVETLALENCGHSPHRDQPEQTFRRVVAFLNSDET